MTDFERPAQLQKGLILLDQNRYPEAAATFKDFLTTNPQHAYALYLLASCQYHLPKEQKQALLTIDQAISLDPQRSWFHELKAMILAAMGKGKNAMAVVDEALRLDPFSAHAHAVKAYVHLTQDQWAPAEKCAKEALALDADNLFAGNLLATALRMQNKLNENQQLVSDLLAKDPEDAVSHSNAGWVYFQKGNYSQAQIHFRESLRLDPLFEPARLGTLELFKTKSAFYRAYIKYSLFMSRQSKLVQWAIILGIIFGFRAVRYALQHSFNGQLAFLTIWFAALYFIFIFWTWFAPGVGNLIILLDPFARFALKKSERLDAIFVGGMMCGGLVMAILGVGFALPVCLLLGATAVASSIPFSCTFTNERQSGQYFYGAIAGIIWLLGLVAIGAELLNAQTAVSKICLTSMIFLFIICTWLGAFGFMRRK